MSSSPAARSSSSTRRRLARWPTTGCWRSFFFVLCFLHTYMSSIDMYNNDVGKESAQNL